MYGWRKRIGYISPAIMEVNAYDFYQVAPEGVGMVAVTCDIDGWAEDQYENALAQVDRAAEHLASRNVDFIWHAGVPLVVGRGKPFDQELVDRIVERTGIPATTSTQAAMAAFEHLGLTNVVLVCPYPDNLIANVEKFYGDYGINIVHSATIHADFKAFHATPPDVMHRLASEALAAAPDVDGIYMPCPQWPVMDIVDVLERDLGKPVVAGSPAEFWYAFRELGIRDEIRGYGSLLASLSR